MANDKVRLTSPDGPAEWPPSGRVRPILSSRVEARVKELAERGRRVLSRKESSLSDLERVYREAASTQPRFDVPAVTRAFRSAFDQASAVDASLAALALAVATGRRPKILGLVEHLGLCYAETRLDAAVAALGERLGAAGAGGPGSALAGLHFEDGWQTFAASARRFAADSLAPEMRRPQRGRIRGADVGPRRAVVRVSGGLGNQMFQYAAGLAYARRCGLPLRLDLFHYERPKPDREFLLGRLRVPVRRASSFEVLWARRRPFWEVRGYFADFLLGDHGSVWLCGFWEDPAYFADVVETVKRRFVPRDPAITNDANALVERAREGGGPVVGIHLRRGDRGPGGIAHAPFSTMPPEYYREAAARFPHGTNFLVFSDTPDDIAWCRANLGLGNEAHLVFGEGRDPILDLFALARCDHVILSAGTFSWWGGYLGERDARRVIVPNPLQALSASAVVFPPTSPPLEGWEVLTLAPA